jgi:UDP-3-O-[3-hydroxymyristoyl] glucosamine N-acyltransferase
LGSFALVPKHVAGATVVVGPNVVLVGTDDVVGDCVVVSAEVLVGGVVVVGADEVVGGSVGVGVAVVVGTGPVVNIVYRNSSVLPLNALILLHRFS